MNLSERLFLPIMAGALITLAVILNAGFYTASRSSFESRVAASGAATETSDTTQVYVQQDEDGTTYLTSRTVPATSSTTTSSTNTTSLFGGTFEAPQGFAANLSVWLNAILSFVMIVSALLVLLYLIWGAIEWITSGGDKGKVDQARQKIIAAVIGIIIVAASYAVFLLVLNFVGFESTEDLFSNLQSIDGSSTEFRDADDFGDLLDDTDSNQASEATSTSQ
jgi:hypothetical protein